MLPSGKHLYHEHVPDNAAHHYYGLLEGPAWENYYCAWRTYTDYENRNCVDMTGKYKYGPSLSNYNDPAVDVHADNPWGTDIFEIGYTLGLGAFRVQYGDTVWRNPQMAVNLDSLVVDLIDTSYTSPKFRIAYWGWKITTTAKINAFWTFQTKKTMRSTVCDLKIEGQLNNTKIVVGMTKIAGTTLTQDAAKGNLITIGKQSQFLDSLMMAIHADTPYFNKFTSDKNNWAMLLNLDANQTARWAFTFSWVKEPAPLFRQSNWQASLFTDLSQIVAVSKDGFQKPRDNKYRGQENALKAGSMIAYNISGKVVHGNFSSFVSNRIRNQVPNGIYFVKDKNAQHAGLVRICSINK
jgi:hypothetical protein